MAKLNINVLLQNTANVTVANIQDLNDYIKTAIPSAKLTWCPDNNFVFPGNKNAENTLVNGFLQSGDDFAMGDGFPAVNFPNIEDYKAQVDEFWNTGFSRYGKTPKVATSWHYTAEQLQYLESKGVEIVTGTVWSQTNVDRFQGEGSRLFPYYPSKTNSFVPARNGSDKINIVSMNSLTADPLGCRVLTGDSRWTLHPADPNPNSSAVQKYIFDEYSKNDFPMCVYIEVDWLYGSQNLLARFKEFIDYIKTKEVEVLTMSEFNNYFRAVFPTNDFEVSLVFEGSGISYGNSQSDSNKIQYWYENKFGSVCLEKNKTTQEITTQACVRYIPNISETRGYFLFDGHFYKDYSYRIGKSYKFDQLGEYKNREVAGLVAMAKKYFLLDNL